MKKRYYSEIGLSFYLMAVIPLGIIVVLMALEGLWMIILLTLFLSAFILHMMLNTWYEIEGENLCIRCGIFYRTNIPVKEIRHLKKSNNPISSPALSLDRIEVRYGTRASILISPKNRDEFYRHLTMINPAIEIKV